MKYIVVHFVLLLLILCLSGCGESEGAYWATSATELTADSYIIGMNVSTEESSDVVGEETEETIDLPCVELFYPDCYDADENYRFADVDYVIYHHDGIGEQIAEDDPRLIILLNFLANSDAQGLSAMRQGYVEEAEINACLGTNAPMLEIRFKDWSNDTYLSDYTGVLICGKQYLAFIDTEKPTWVLGEGLYAEQIFPYDSLLMDAYENGVVEEDVIFENEWGQKTWLDILRYVGF